MTAYLGTPGRMIPIYSNPSMTVSGLPKRTYETTLEGRVKAQVGQVGRRAWELQAQSATPTEAATLRGFAAGEWGLGPFVWVAPTAPVVNLLTPEQASCDPGTLANSGVTAAGPLDLGADGWAGRSFVNASPGTPFYFGTQAAPAIQGQRVTASAYVVGAGAGVRIQWVDAAGAVVSSSYSASSGVAGVAKRMSVTALPPVNAVGAQVQATSATQGARPALTWTDTVFEWGAGEGCPKAIVDELGSTALGASNRINGYRDSDISFRIKEVG